MVFVEINRKKIVDMLIGYDANFREYKKKIVIFNEYGSYVVLLGEEIDFEMVR